MDPDPDPGGPKTRGSSGSGFGSGSATLHGRIYRYVAAPITYSFLPVLNIRAVYLANFLVEPATKLVIMWGGERLLFVNI
jgi:hypothetical protein